MKKPAPVCSCGKQSEHKQFSTFEYFFCPACKTEVGGKAAPVTLDDSAYVITASQAISSLHANIARQLYGSPGPAAAPPPHGLLHMGIVALRGEAVSCEGCGYEFGTLSADLPLFKQPLPQYGGLLPGVDWDQTKMWVGCHCGQNKTWRKTGLNDYELHIVGRGWC